MKHHFSIIREILQDAADMETHADNERACLTGRTTPNSAFVALEAIEARVAELERDLDRERESNKRLATKILKLTEVKRSR